MDQNNPSEADMSTLNESVSQAGRKEKKRKLKHVSNARLNCSFKRPLHGQGFRSKQINMTLNSTMVKQSLRSNNRALAKALETVKRAYASLLQQHIDLKSEHQAALSKLSHLEAVTTMKNEQIDREVDRRIQVRLEEIESIMRGVAGELGHSLTSLGRAILQCNRNNDHQSHSPRVSGAVLSPNPNSSSVKQSPSNRSTTLRTSEGNMDDRKSCQHSKDPKLPGLMELESRLEEDKMRNDATDAGRTSHGALAVSFSDGMVEENAFIMDAPLLFEDESPTSGIVEPQENAGRRGRASRSNRRLTLIHSSMGEDAEEDTELTIGPRRSVRSRSRSRTRQDAFSFAQANIPTAESLVSGGQDDSEVRVSLKEDSRESEGETTVAPTQPSSSIDTCVKATPNESSNSPDGQSKVSQSKKLRRKVNEVVTETAVDESPGAQKEPGIPQDLDVHQVFLPTREIPRTPPSRRESLMDEEPEEAEQPAAREKLVASKASSLESNQDTNGILDTALTRESPVVEPEQPQKKSHTKRRTFSVEKPDSRKHLRRGTFVVSVPPATEQCKEEATHEPEQKSCLRTFTLHSPAPNIHELDEDEDLMNESSSILINDDDLDDKFSWEATTDIGSPSGAPEASEGPDQTIIQEQDMEFTAVLKYDILRVSLMNDAAVEETTSQAEQPTSASKTSLASLKSKLKNRNNKRKYEGSTDFRTDDVKFSAKEKDKDSSSSASKAKDKDIDSSNSASNAQDKHSNSSSSASKAKDKDIDSSNSASHAKDKEHDFSSSVSRARDRDINSSNSVSKARDKDIDSSSSVSKAKDKDINSSSSVSKAKDKDINSSNSVSKAKDKDIDSSSSVSKAKDKAIDSSSSVSKAKDRDINSSNSVSKAKDKDIDSSNSVSKAKDKDIDSSSSVSKAKDRDINSSNSVSKAKDRDINSSNSVSKAKDKDINSSSSTSKAKDKDICDSEESTGTQDDEAVKKRKKVSSQIKASENEQSKEEQVQIPFKRERRQTRTIKPAIVMSGSDTDDGDSSFEVFKKPKRPVAPISKRRSSRAKKPIHLIEGQELPNENQPKKSSEAKTTKETHKYQALSERPGKIVFRAGRMTQQEVENVVRTKVQSTKGSKVKSLLPKPDRPRSKRARSKTRMLPPESEITSGPVKKDIEKENKQGLKTIFDMSLNESVTVLPQMSYKDFREQHPSYEADKQASIALSKDTEDVDSPHGIMLVTGRGKRTKPRMRTKSVSYAKDLTEVHLGTPDISCDSTEPGDKSPSSLARIAHASLTPSKLPRTLTEPSETMVPETPEQQNHKANVELSLSEPEPDDFIKNKRKKTKTSSTYADHQNRKGKNHRDSDLVRQESPVAEARKHMDLFPHPNMEGTTPLGRNVSKSLSLESSCHNSVEKSENVPNKKRTGTNKKPRVSSGVTQEHSLQPNTVVPHEEEKRRPRRTPLVSYKEPTLNAKLRRGDPISKSTYKGEDTDKVLIDKTNRGDKRKRSALSTITNVGGDYKLC